MSHNDSNTGPSAFRYRSGLGHASAYVVSGKPFLSGALNAMASMQVVKFPAVTRWVRVINQSTVGTPEELLKCSYSANGLSGDEYFTLYDRASSRTGHNMAVFEVKVTEMYFTGSSNFDVIAGLTNINVNEIYQNWSGSAGVG